jgi:hypothetical protein
MFKYLRFTPVPLAYTTLTFLGGDENVKVNYFDKPFVSIEAENEADINALIVSQPNEIGCTEITKEEFVQLVKTTKQYKRIIERGNEKLEQLTEDIVKKYPVKERETWHIQLGEALKYIETQNEADAPFLKILADNENDTVAAFANAVINNNNAFIALSASALSQKRLLEQELLKELGA